MLTLYGVNLTNRLILARDKTIFKWNCSPVCDVVRGVMEYGGENALERVLDCLDILSQHPDIQVQLKTDF